MTNHPTEQPKHDGSAPMVKLNVRVPPDIEALIRERAEERAQSMADYMRAVLSATPAEVHQAILLNARYAMALETIVKLGSSFHDEHKIARLALDGRRS